VNVVLILIDSLNRHDLPAYGGDVVPTPNLDRLARRAVRFDSHFVGSLPCMPARRELFAGFKELFWRPWGPLERFDRRLPRLVERAGHRTVLVTDHYHYWEETANGYLQSFQAVELIRGHEHDNWRGSVPEDEPVPAWVERIERWRPGAGRRYWANVRDVRGEEDFFPARTFSAAAGRLAELRGPFFLQVESFDVHEPFHVPEPYRSRFGDASGFDRYTVWPPYQDWDALKAFMAETTPGELAFVRAQYLAKVALVDRWLGELLDVLDRRALWGETAVILTTDHGHDLGERGAFGKQYPHWDSHANIPLLVWHPAFPGDGRTVDAPTQTVDLHATIAELCGADVAGAPHGRSLLPLLRGEPFDRGGLAYGTFGEGVCVTDGDWTLFKSPPGDGPLFAYSSLFFESNEAATLGGPVESGTFIPGVAIPQWRIPVARTSRSREDFLFDRRADPGQTRNLWHEAPEERERLLGLLLELVEREGAPPEQLERLGLR
jgi:arylsulfatase A-like enzyme